MQSIGSKFSKLRMKYILALFFTALAFHSANAQTKAVTKTIATGAVTEGFTVPSGTTITLSNGSTLAFGASATVTGKTTLSSWGISDALTSSAAAAAYQPLSSRLTTLAGTSGTFATTGANIFTSEQGFSGTGYCGLNAHQLSDSNASGFTPAAGMIYYNTSSNAFKVYENAAWRSMVTQGPTLSGPYWKLRTNLVSWTSNNVYLYDTVYEMPSSVTGNLSNSRFVIVSGTGWTPGVYTPASVAAAFATGTGDGNKNMWNFNPGRPATAGSRGGVGYFLGEYGTHRIICVGNSLTLGTGASNTITGVYPDMLRVSLIGQGKHYDVVNLGISGAVGADLLNATNFPNAVSYYQPAIYKDTVFCLWEITNDLKSGFSAMVAFDNVCKLAARIRTACPRAKIIVGTCLPRTETGTPADFEANRQLVNGWMLQGRYIPSLWDGVADLGGNATIGAVGASDNTTNYASDKVHLKEAGYTVAESVWEAAVLSVITP
jgi:lysophospholipase L1-like esterase